MVATEDAVYKLDGMRIRTRKGIPSEDVKCWTVKLSAVAAPWSAISAVADQHDCISIAVTDMASAVSRADAQVPFLCE